MVYERSSDIEGGPMPIVESQGASARRITVTALLAALLAASVLVTVPLGTVPLTLQVLVVVLIALTVPPGWAALAVGTYLIAGAVGLPVFSGFRGGLGVLFGPTGGYLFGFLIGAVAASWVRVRVDPGHASAIEDVGAAVIVILVVYVVGWLQLALVTGMGAVPALLAGVVPFVVPDALKAAVAVVIAPVVRRAMRV
jgi:biotin transport system substrate-specific component